MRVMFWIFAVLWIPVAFCQLMAKGLSTYAGAYGNGKWGIRFTEDIVLAEFALLFAVVCVLYSCSARIHGIALSVGVLGCLGLLGLQMQTYDLDSSYVFRSKLVDQKYEIPWQYHPFRYSPYHPQSKEGPDAVGIWVAYPGFAPIADGLSKNQSKVWLRKSMQDVGLRQDTLINLHANSEKSACEGGGNWTKCNFHDDGFRYDYGFQDNTRLPLKGAKEQIPLIFDGFVAN